MYLKIKTSATYIAGIGPTAWNRDLKPVKVYTHNNNQHHEVQHHEVQHHGRRKAEVEVRTV